MGKTRDRDADGSGVGSERRSGPVAITRLGLIGLAAALLFAPEARLAAQIDPRAPRITIGLAAGGGAGQRNAIFPIYATGSDCGEFNGASTRSAWGELQLGLPGFFQGPFGLALGFGWENQAALYTAAAVEPFWVSDRNGNPIQIDHEFHYNTLAPLYRLSLGLDFRIASRLALTLGPWIGYRSTMAAAQTENVLGNYRFAGNLSSREMDSVLSYSSSFTAKRIAAGASLGASVELPIGRRLMLKPQVGLDLELTSAFDQIPASGFGVRAGLGIAYDLTPAERSVDTVPAPVRPPDPVPQTPPVASAPPRSTRLTAAIELYGVDDHGGRLPAATVHVFRVLHRSTVPLASAIAFDRNSSLLSSRYPQLTRARAAQFTPDSLAGLDLRRIELNSLNMLGWRLRENPSAHVTLRGSAARGEPSWLAYARMETLRSYLEEVWGIDKARIDIQPAGSGRPAQRSSRSGDGERSVSIASDSPGIMDPIVVTSREQNFEPPLVRVVPRYDAGAGVKEWHVSLSHEGTVIARYVNGAAEGAANPEWRVSDEQMQSGNSYLIAELTVEDSLGAMVSAQSQSPMAFDRNVRIVDARLLPDGRERTIFTLFAADSATFENRNGDLLDEIAARVRPGEKLAVVPLGGPGATAGKGMVDRVMNLLKDATNRAGHAPHQMIASSGGAVDPEILSELTASNYRPGDVAIVLETPPGPP